MVNPIQQLKNKQSCHPYQLLSQGESPDKLLQEQQIEIENQEEITQNNYIDNTFYFGIQLDKKRQKEIAIIEVDSSLSDEDCIIISCHHGLLKIGEQLKTEPIKAPKISFNKNIEAKKFEEMIGEMRMFSQENSQAKRLRGWLLKLQERLENECQHQLSYLIINDRTKFEIPWEMLELKKNNYLGASIVTVRWQDITNPDDLDNVNSLIDLEIKENHCCGNMVAYLYTEDLPSVEEEKKTIERFNPIVHENIHNFFNFLDSVDLKVSLIFIASHGFFEYDFSQIKLGGKDSKKQISLTKLYEYDFGFLANSSLVFMNTCHSGRLQQDDSLNIIDPNPETGQNYPIGFSTFFLKKRAAGVIGTLCKVDDGYAAKISGNFFAEYQQNPHLSVAEIFKNIRLKASEKYQSQKTPENKYLLLFTFMYIYYGNPMTKLELTEKEGGK